VTVGAPRSCATLVILDTAPARRPESARRAAAARTARRGARRSCARRCGSGWRDSVSARAAAVRRSDVLHRSPLMLPCVPLLAALRGLSLPCLPSRMLRLAATPLSGLLIHCPRRIASLALRTAVLGLSTLALAALASQPCRYVLDPGLASHRSPTLPCLTLASRASCSCPPLPCVMLRRSAPSQPTASAVFHA
jgi:hypothetical protein